MRKLLAHFIFWSLFFLTWYRVVYFYVSDTGNRLYFTLLDVSLAAMAFYVVYLLIIPYYLRRRNNWQLFISVLATAILLATLCYWLMLVFLRHVLVPIHFDLAWNYTDLQYNRFFIALIGVFAGCFIKLATGRLKAEKRLEQLETQQRISELTYLKAQLNPHFLFNSLNTLYAQLETEPQNAKGTLDALAGLLRYQLYECDAALIPVEKEIGYLKRYFELQSLRKDNCRLTFDIQTPGSGLLIAPLLLVPFLENAFKFVSDYDDTGNYIDAAIRFEGNQLHFFCSNSCEDHDTAPGTGGIGAANVKKRLALLYPGKFELKTGPAGHDYKVTLTLNLC